MSATYFYSPQAITMTTRHDIPPRVDRYLRKIYYNPAQVGSFGGARRLYETVKQEGKYNLSLSFIRKWLSGQETYSLHRPVLRKFKTNHVITSGPFAQADTDLMDMTRYAKQNDNMRFVLIVIDIFSKYLWVAALKSKTAKDVIAGFEAIMSQQKHPIRTYRSDMGKEYVAGPVQSYFTRNNINHITTQNPPKANFAERVIRTIKSKIMRYFTEHQTHRYIDILPKLVASYNRTKHTTTGVAPVNVNQSNAQAIWDRVYASPRLYRQLVSETNTRERPYRFKVGDYVRVSYLKQAFTRGSYDQGWSGEIFQIMSRRKRQDIPVYTLRDYSGQDITGTFYEPELQKITFKANALYKIERIIKKKVSRGRTSYLVKWQNWPSFYNSYITQQQLQTLR